MKINRIINLITILSIFTLIIGCGVKSQQQKGSVTPLNFHYKTDFTTIKSLMLLPAKINGTTKNFLFDTGAQLSLIQRDSLSGKTGKYSGASKRKMELGNEVVASIEIGDINFQNTNALNGDLVGLKEKIPNFGGLIGQPIIRQANWLIDNPNKKLEVSNTQLVDPSFQAIKIVRNGGSPYTWITLLGKKYKAVIDMGSTASLNIPEGSKLAKVILNTYQFDENVREIYSLGGLQNVKEKVGTIPLIKLDSLEFTDVKTDIRNSSQLRLGMKFFEDCIIYIDNIEGDYKVKKVRTN